MGKDISPTGGSKEIVRDKEHYNNVEGKHTESTSDFIKTLRIWLGNKKKKPKEQDFNIKNKPSGKHYDPNDHITKQERTIKKIKKLLIKTGKFIIYLIVWVILTQLLVNGLLLFINMDRDILAFFVGTALIFFLLEFNRRMNRKKRK
jgi:hypothetical protein